jgi:proline dehydrogenase
MIDTEPTTNLALYIAISMLVIAAILILYRYGERWLRFFLIYLSHSVVMRNIIERLPIALSVARRFVAGQTIDEAMEATIEINARGMMVTLDYLGESVTDTEVAISARNEILQLLERINAESVDANVSVKLSQLGLRIDEILALDSLRLILTKAGEYDNKVRIDMEESALVDTTLDLYRTLRDDYGLKNVGVVIQSYLYRSEDDVRQLIHEGAWVRLCKGAYAEPPDIAYPNKDDTDKSFVHLTELMLSQKARENGVYLGVATHDEKMIQATLQYVESENIKPDEFEFQMLYGIRRDLQQQLVDDGYRVRIYVPYGTAWYPYFVRRLAERPANMWFFIRNFFKR